MILKFHPDSKYQWQYQSKGVCLTTVNDNLLFAVKPQDAAVAVVKKGRGRPCKIKTPEEAAAGETSIWLSELPPLQ